MSTERTYGKFCSAIIRDNEEIHLSLRLDHWPHGIELLSARARYFNTRTHLTTFTSVHYGKVWRLSRVRVDMVCIVDEGIDSIGVKEVFIADIELLGDPFRQIDQVNGRQPDLDLLAVGFVCWIG